MEPTKRQRWSDELIESELRRITAEIGRFPSNPMLVKMGHGSLASAMGKRGGIFAWADRLGVDRERSDSDFGWEGEAAIIDLFVRAGHRAELAASRKAPFDIIVDDVIRIDVKTANYAEYNVCKGWFYRIAKLPQADLIVLYQADTKDFYGLPWWVCPTSNVTLSRSGGIYAGYRNNWTLIREMIGMRMAERARYGHVAVADVA